LPPKSNYVEVAQLVRASDSYPPGADGSSDRWELEMKFLR